MRKVLLHCNTAIKSSGLACTSPEKKVSFLLCGRVSLESKSKTFINILELIVPSGLTVSNRLLDEKRMVPIGGKIPLWQWASLDTLCGWISGYLSKLDCFLVSHGVFISITQVTTKKELKLSKFTLMDEPIRMQIIQKF